MLTLYSYFRSSASFRVRIALNLKRLPYQTMPVHLLRQGGEQHSATFRERNPSGLVPVLVDGDLSVPQSLAIIEYLEETYPTPRLLPSDTAERARVRSLAAEIACEIHPLNNLRVLQYLTGTFEISEEQKMQWYRHWVNEGLHCLETQLARSPRTGHFCHGDTPGFADCFLIPQLFNAERFHIKLDSYPVALAIYQRCLGLPEFAAAHPSQQPDTE